LTDHEPFDELPQALQDALQGLGGERAPVELWHRVTLARSEQVSAPTALWDRIAPAVAEEAAARSAATAAPASGRLLQFPRRRWAAAAAALVAGVSTALFVPFGSGSAIPDLEPPRAEAVRAGYRSRFVSEEVHATEMSPTGRKFVEMFGGERES
jgi:hypothetical protein